MCHFLRYGVSHCLQGAMTRLSAEEVSVRSSLRMLGYLSGLNLVVALCLGLYARWESTAETSLLVTFILALVVLGVAGVVYCSSSMDWLSLGLLHLWVGFLLGLQCFLNSAPLEMKVKVQAADYLLLSSVSLRTLWALLERLLRYTTHRPAFLTSQEQLEMVGFAAASTALRLQSSLSVMVLVLALATVMVALRMKTFLAHANLICFAVVTGVVFFKSLNVSTNPFALSCFFIQLICDPLLDVYFSGLSVTERWQPFLVWRALWRRLSLLPLMALEVTFIVLAAQKLRDMDQWYLMIPLFVLLSICWAISHMMFVFTVWGFHTKLSECQRLSSSQGSGVRGLNKIMASQGMRHFCLISADVVVPLLVSTGVVAAFYWQDSSSIFLSIFLLVLNLESLFHGLFHELGKSLGGTCVGYALVIPTNFCSLDGQPMLLPPNQVQELNARSTSLLNNIQRFFAHHFIESFGCDYSTSGVNLEAQRSKIQSFFDLRMANGPCHDTYVIFYSGPTHRSGDWALTGGDALHLDQILEWWRERNGSLCSRLIFVLDCDNSLPWVNEVKRVESLYVAVQGATLSRVSDVEHQDPPQLGDFTSRWVEYNCNSNSNIQWSESGRAISATYGISKYWSDYTLHLPTGSDLTRYWSVYFPQITRSVVQVVLASRQSSDPNQPGYFTLGLRYLKRLKINLFPPAILDTGQGFKLVRS